MNLDDYFWLPRAGRFSSAAFPNDRLPIVMGDPEDVLLPIFPGYHKLVCINKSTTIDTAIDYGIDYCYSVGRAGWTPSAGPVNLIFKNGSKVDIANYSLISSHYEAGDLHITYIRFSTNWPNLNAGDVVSALSYGISSSTNSTTPVFNLMENIKNFLINISSFPSTLIDSKSFNECVNIMETYASTSTGTAQVSYGIISEDDTYWNILQKMMGSFGGYCYMNAQGRLAFKIMTTSINPYSIAAVIPKHETELISARQKAGNLINQCPISLKYSHVDGEFKSHLDAVKDTLSQNIYGKQEPATPLQSYFCYQALMATQVQNVMVHNFKHPKWEITFEDKTLKRSHLDVGDIIVASFDELYQKDGNPFTNRGLEIIGINPNYSEGSIQFRCWDLGLNMDSSHMLSTSTAYDMTEY